MASSHGHWALHDRKKEDEDKKEPAGEEEESLTSILSAQQRTSLTRLLAEATALMRQAIEDNLSVSASDEMAPEEEISKAGSTIAATDKNAKDDDNDNDNNEANNDPENRKREQKLLELRQKELSAPSMTELKTAVLAHFDDWRVAMIKRIAEVVNTPANHAVVQLESASPPSTREPPASDAIVSLDPTHTKTSTDETAAMKKAYPPLITPLAALSERQRVLVLRSVLLLVLSLKHYSAYSRIMLLRLTSSLDLPLSTLRHSEETTAHTLLSAVSSDVAGTHKRAEDNAHEHAHSRAWKVGAATVAGAAVIGLTGGLAAPLVAAGLGSLMGGLGLGATAAAGYLGSMAGSTVLVGSLFGAYGGRMTGQVMDKYAKEVQDFAFLPVVQDVRKSARLTDNRKEVSNAQTASNTTDGHGNNPSANPVSRKLRVAIGISGWLTESDQVVTPWRVIGSGTEVVALRFELEALLNLGNSITSMVHSAAWGYARKEIIKRTILADMTLALWPLGLLKISRVVDNPFSIALARADKAGELLADALIDGALGQRPVTLVGYSLGARVACVCLLQLARRRAFGLVESAVLMGAPTASAAPAWRAMRAVVAGRLVNVFSANDYVLGFLYRTSSIQLGVAGLQAIEAVPGVENVDVSGSVSGHLRYQFMVGRLLSGIGFEDVLVDEVHREAVEDVALRDGGKDSRTDTSTAVDLIKDSEKYSTKDSVEDSTKASEENLKEDSKDSTADLTKDANEDLQADSTSRGLPADSTKALTSSSTTTTTATTTTQDDAQQLANEVEAKTRHAMLQRTAATSLPLSGDERLAGGGHEDEDVAHEMHHHEKNQENHQENHEESYLARASMHLPWS